jgi:hypothetical protein
MDGDVDVDVDDDDDKRVVHMARPSGIARKLLAGATAYTFARTANDAEQMGPEEDSNTSKTTPARVRSKRTLAPDTADDDDDEVLIVITTRRNASLHALMRRSANSYLNIRRRREKYKMKALHARTAAVLCAFALVMSACYAAGAGTYSADAQPALSTLPLDGGAMQVDISKPDLKARPSI